MKRIKLSIFKWCVISFLCIYFGFMMGKFQKDVLEHEIELSELEVISLNSDNTDLIENLSLIQADLSAEKQINNVLKSENKKLNDSLEASNNKLYFYEQVVAPELAVTGLNVYSFKVEKSEREGIWSYELVLMQAQKGRSELTGNIEIMFSDNNDNEADNKVIKLSEYNDNFEPEFKFKYFQTLKGIFVLPHNIQVEQLFVVAQAKATRYHRAQRIEKIYNWKGFVESDSSALEELEIQAE